MFYTLLFFTFFWSLSVPSEQDICDISCGEDCGLFSDYSYYQEQCSLDLWPQSKRYLTVPRTLRFFTLTPYNLLFKKISAGIVIADDIALPKISLALVTFDFNAHFSFTTTCSFQLLRGAPRASLEGLFSLKKGQISAAFKAGYYSEKLFISTEERTTLVQELQLYRKVCVFCNFLEGTKDDKTLGVNSNAILALIDELFASSNNSPLSDLVQLIKTTIFAQLKNYYQAKSSNEVYTDSVVIRRAAAQALPSLYKLPFFYFGPTITFI